MSAQTVYTVRATGRAERKLRRLPQDVIRRINAIFEQLKHNPRPRGTVKFTTQTGSPWRIRVGMFRQKGTPEARWKRGIFERKAEEGD